MQRILVKSISRAIEELLSAGADTTIVNQKGETVESLALESHAARAALKKHRNNYQEKSIAFFCGIRKRSE